MSRETSDLFVCLFFNVGFYEERQTEQPNILNNKLISHMMSMIRTRDTLSLCLHGTGSKRIRSENQTR